MKVVRWFAERLHWGIGALLLTTAVLITWGLTTIRDRELLLAQGSMERAAHSAQAQLDALFRSYEQDLEEEAAFIRSHDTIPDELVLRRWITVMSSRWPIRAVLLASEQGDERSLARSDTAWWYARTDDSLTASSPAHALHGMGPDGLTIRYRPADTLRDPRGEHWFVHALKDRTNAVVWSSDGQDNAHDLELSILIRGSNDTVPFRIMAFILDAPSLLNRALDLRQGEESHQLLKVNGVPLSHTTDSAAINVAQDTLLARWKRRPSKAMRPIDLDGIGYYGQVMPFTLNGETLQLASVLDGRRLHGWLQPDRLGLKLAALFILTLSGLLIWARIRQRQAARRLRRQELDYLAQQRRLAKAIGERNVLDQEVHHRVKNNLQVVSSLLNLQAQRLPEGEARSEFMRGKQRIDMMALVHHKLYALQDLRSIRLKVFFTELGDALRAQQQPSKRNISMAVDTSDIVADPDTAIEVGIVLCELLQNSLSHAFPYATGGHIDIRTRHLSEDMFELEVSDNGAGMHEKARLDETKMGLEIVEALAQQLDGSLQVHSERNKGVRCVVRFRMLHPVG